MLKKVKKSEKSPRSVSEMNMHQNYIGNYVSECNLSKMLNAPKSLLYQ